MREGNEGYRFDFRHAEDSGWLAIDGTDTADHDPNLRTLALLRNTRTSPRGITLLHIDNGTN